MSVDELIEKLRQLDVGDYDVTASDDAGFFYVDRLVVDRKTATVRLE